MKNIINYDVREFKLYNYNLEEVEKIVESIIKKESLNGKIQGQVLVSPLDCEEGLSIYIPTKCTFKEGSE